MTKGEGINLAKYTMQICHVLLSNIIGCLCYNWSCVVGPLPTLCQLQNVYLSHDFENSLNDFRITISVYCVNSGIPML